jgi:hypothetical protein
MPLFTPTMFYRPRVVGPVLPNIDQTNLLRWYDADFGASSSTWVDQTGNDDATVSGPTYTTGGGGFYYYDFPGGSGNEIGNAATSTLSLSTMSIQMWVRHATTTNSNFAVVSQRSVVGTAGVRYSMHLNPSNNRVGIYNGSGFTANVITTQNSNTWYFFEFLMSTTQVVVYKNNVSVGTITRGINTGAGDEALGIGTPNYGYTTYSGEFWNGDIAMCLIYSGNTRPTGNWDATKSRFGY